MSGRLSDLKDKWLSLTCPACRTKMRIREAYAHLKGRCPECGYRMQAPRPKPAPPPVDYSGVDVPIGLEPVEEEWPEPALLEREEQDQGSTYLVAEPHATPALPTPIGVDDDELFDRAMAKHDPSVPVNPSAPSTKKSPYELRLPAGDAIPNELPITYRLSRAEREPLRAPPPPPWPLWQGIYTFPWRGDSLGLWLALSLKFGIIAVLTCLLFHCIDLWQNSGTETRFVGLFVPPLVVGICMVSLWVGAYASVQFLAILEDTAAGNDRVPRPEWTVAEGIMKCGYLLWIAAGSMIPGTFVVYVAGHLFPRGLPAVLTVLVPALLLFPVMLLSSLSGQAIWVLLERRFLNRYLARPEAVLAATIPPFVLTVPCVALTWYAFSNSRFGIAFLSGFLWSACFLIYARLLGRVAWHTTLRTPKRPAKREKTSEPEGEESEARSTESETNPNDQDTE